MRAPRLLLGILGVSLVACGGDDDSGTIDARRVDSSVPIDAGGPDASGTILPEDLPSPLPDGPVEANVMSFNIGLITTVKGRLERLPHIIDAIEASDMDIVCIEEAFISFYDENDPDTFINPPLIAAELDDTYPYIAYDQAGETSFRNGLMILSKVPLYRQRFFAFTMNDENGIVDRAVLAATAVSDDWHLNIVCTHLQAGLDESNTLTRRDQLREIDLLAEAEGYNDGPSVLLGDFNAGPDTDTTNTQCEGISGCPAACTPMDTETITSVSTVYGWDDWADDLNFNLCTYCKDEADALAHPILLFPCEGDQRIDHCFTRNLGTAEVIGMERAMTQVFDDPDDPKDGPLATTQGDVNTLSDHFAVQCEIGVPPP
jgi:endonuclease/exonuclease/phosphatase family metal-dependent hydrolase